MVTCTNSYAERTAKYEVIRDQINSVGLGSTLPVSRAEGSRFEATFIDQKENLLKIVEDEKLVMTKDLISRVADELTAEQYSVTNPIGVRPMAADFYIYMGYQLSWLELPAHNHQVMGFEPQKAHQ